MSSNFTSLVLNSTNETLARTSKNVATEPWFIGMMVSVILLIIILINVCILVRERGGKYSVQEKEPFQNQMLASESQGFDEYEKGPGDGGMANQNLVTGPSNMYFDEKQYHDEDDSMAEYGNGENGKFNEDGSFIGLYGRDRIQTYVVQYNQGQNQNESENPGSSKPYTSFV